MGIMVNESDWRSGDAHPVHCFHALHGEKRRTPRSGESQGGSSQAPARSGTVAFTRLSAFCDTAASVCKLAMTMCKWSRNGHSRLEAGSATAGPFSSAGGLSGPEDARRRVVRAQPPPRGAAPVSVGATYKWDSATRWKGATSTGRSLQLYRMLKSCTGAKTGAGAVGGGRAGARSLAEQEK